MFNAKFPYIFIKFSVFINFTGVTVFSTKTTAFLYLLHVTSISGLNRVLASGF